MDIISLRFHGTLMERDMFDWMVSRNIANMVLWSKLSMEEDLVQCLQK
jgi:hypothetical protein